MRRAAPSACAARVTHTARFTGEVSASYVPAGVQPDPPRNQAPIASNLIIDAKGKIVFYSLLDSVNFDARLVALEVKLEQLLASR